MFSKEYKEKCESALVRLQSTRLAGMKGAMEGVSCLLSHGRDIVQSAEKQEELVMYRFCNEQELKFSRNLEADGRLRDLIAEYQPASQHRNRQSSIQMMVRKAPKSKQKANHTQIRTEGNSYRL